MTNSKSMSVGIAAVLLTLFAGSVASAASHNGDGFQCLLSRSPFNTHHIVTVCTGRTPEAMARLRASTCDPARMSDAAMRVQCLAMMSEPKGNASKPASAG